MATEKTAGIVPATEKVLGAETLFKKMPSTFALKPVTIRSVNPSPLKSLLASAAVPGGAVSGPNTAKFPFPLLINEKNALSL